MKKMTYTEYLKVLKKLEIKKKVSNLLSIMFGICVTITMIVGILNPCEVFTEIDYLVVLGIIVKAAIDIWLMVAWAGVSIDTEFEIRKLNRYIEIIEED